MSKSARQGLCSCGRPSISPAIRACDRCFWDPPPTPAEQTDPGRPLDLNPDMPWSDADIIDQLSTAKPVPGFVPSRERTADGGA